MARRRRKSPIARLWQVWLKSACENGTYWIESATPDFARATARYAELRADYMMAEVRTPLGDVYASHDPARDPGNAGREELEWEFDVQTPGVRK